RSKAPTSPDSMASAAFAWASPVTRSLFMTTGTVKWFNATKGYGFIAPDDGGKDVFVHATAVERSSLGSINEGQKLSFELERDPPRGPVGRRAGRRIFRPLGQQGRNQGQRHEARAPDVRRRHALPAPRQRRELLRRVNPGDSAYRKRPERRRSGLFVWADWAL